MTEAERWLEQARRDLDDARYAATGQRWNLTCFLIPMAFRAVFPPTRTPAVIDWVLPWVSESPV